MTGKILRKQKGIWDPNDRSEPGPANSIDREVSGTTPVSPFESEERSIQTGNI